MVIIILEMAAWQKLNIKFTTLHPFKWYKSSKAVQAKEMRHHTWD